MDVNEIMKELEEYPQLKNLFNIVRGLEPESVSAITAFAVKCYDEETEGYSPEYYRTLELLRGDGYKVELREVTRADDEDYEHPPYVTEVFERAVVFCDLTTDGGAGLFKRILTTDFEIESIDCVGRYDANNKPFEIISKPMNDAHSMSWYQGLALDLANWNTSQILKSFNNAS